MGSYRNSPAHGFTGRLPRYRRFPYGPTGLTDGSLWRTCAKLTADAAIPASSVASKMKSLDSFEAEVIGTVISVCQKRCWLPVGIGEGKNDARLPAPILSSFTRMVAAQDASPCYLALGCRLRPYSAVIFASADVCSDVIWFHEKRHSQLSFGCPGKFIRCSPDNPSTSCMRIMTVLASDLDMALIMSH